jgi:hypothetical protein
MLHGFIICFYRRFTAMHECFVRTIIDSLYFVWEGVMIFFIDSVARTNVGLELLLS